jgi:hypothetical protein
VSNKLENIRQEYFAESNFVQQSTSLLAAFNALDQVPSDVWEPSAFKVRPLMKMTRDSTELPPDTKLVDIDYGDRGSRNYFVGDPKDVDQNRSVFTMLSYLFAQASISTQNLPVQQLIQVH